MSGNKVGSGGRCAQRQSYGRTRSFVVCFSAQPVRKAGAAMRVLSIPPRDVQRCTAPVPDMQSRWRLEQPATEPRLRCALPRDKTDSALIGSMSASDRARPFPGVLWHSASRRTRMMGMLITSLRKALGDDVLKTWSYDQAWG